MPSSPCPYGHDPCPDCAEEDARDAAIRDDFKAGASMDDLALSYRLARGEIEAIIRRGHFPTLEGYDHAEDAD